MITRGFLVALIAMVCGSAYAAVPADPKPHTPAVALMEASALGTPDTAVVVIRWGAVTDARGNPVVRYLWQLRDLVAGSTIGADSTNTALVDTVQVPRALPGDSTIVQAAVAARDVRGKQSSWGMSARLVIPGKPWVAPPAPPVTIDTVAVDSIRIFAPSLALNIDGTYHITVGDPPVQLCGLLYLHDGTKVIDSYCAGLGYQPMGRLLQLAEASQGFRMYNRDGTLLEGPYGWDTLHTDNLSQTVLAPYVHKSDGTPWWHDPTPTYEPTPIPADAIRYRLAGARG